MKTNKLLVLSGLFALACAATVVACSSDNNDDTDSGPKVDTGVGDTGNGQDAGDSGQLDAGKDGPEPCTGLTYDNTKIPGWPNPADPNK